MITAASRETFRPRAHWAPDTPLKRLGCHLRMVVDLQTRSIHRDLRRQLAGCKGRLLDVGCGNSPFRHLLDPQTTTYQGLDVAVAAEFGYTNPDVLYYDGSAMPFPDASFDTVLCTEVLEHVPDPAVLINEILRVLKPGGHLVLTIPWSARFHYQPHDYHRYTPSMLTRLFADFAALSIRARGTDFSAIASKWVVACARHVLALPPTSFRRCCALPFRLGFLACALPALVPLLALGHAGVCWSLGSTADPLGYTLTACKPTA